MVTDILSFRRTDRQTDIKLFCIIDNFTLKFKMFTWLRNCMGKSDFLGCYSRQTTEYCYEDFLYCLSIHAVYNCLNATKDQCIVYFKRFRDFFPGIYFHFLLKWQLPLSVLCFAAYWVVILVLKFCFRLRGVYCSCSIPRAEREINLFFPTKPHANPFLK